MAKFKGIEVSLNLPFIGHVGGTWEPDETERQAAWELYVELVTRVALARTDPQEGGLRGALTSLHSLFDTTRNILRTAGPGVARAKGEGTVSFGYLAVAILNTVLRPVLSRWHPLLLDHEHDRPPGTSVVEHEQNWEKSEELREALHTEVREVLLSYANLLAEVAEVPPLITE